MTNHCKPPPMRETSLCIQTNVFPSCMLPQQLLASSNLHETSLNMIISLLFFQMVFLNVNAQHPAITPQDSSESSNFQPSLVVVIGILAIMFSLTFVLLLYAKFCHRASILNTTLQIPDGILGSWRRSSGIDKTVVESLPFFRFSALRGSKEGLECAVCLSRFEDIEILRLLPKCKHAFHINCIDQWLEKHSSCPLCRRKVSAEDLSVMNFSSSLRFLWSSQSELREESNLELYIQREESFKCGSSRWKPEKIKKKEEKLPIRQQSSSDDDQSLQKPLHHLNHRIIVSDVVLKNRWSSVSSSDLMALTSELIRDAASHRFSSSVPNREFSSSESCRQPDEIQTMSIKEEMERKRLFEIKINKQKASFPIPATSAEPRMSSESATKSLTQNEKRSMSEIVVHPRFTDFNFHNGNLQDSSDVGRRRNLWLPIARRTVQWFAKRERRSSSADQPQIIPSTQHNP